MARILSFIVFLCFRNGLAQRYAGDACNKNGTPGTCMNIRDCRSAQADPRNNKKIDYSKSNLSNPLQQMSYDRDTSICGFANDGYPIVCCLGQSSFQATPASVGSTTTEYVPQDVVYRDNSPNAGGCAPIPSTQTAAKTGRKAWDKCIEYQEKLVYPCTKGVDYLAKLSRRNNCNHKADELIVGGVDAKRNEFPHMALLGYGDDEATAEYQCGGAVISDRFILTAAHCTSTRKQVKVGFAKVGLLKRSESLPAMRVHRIKRIIKHPEYKSPSKYHDIALLETETPILLDETTVPACVDIGEAVDDSRASVTGWGDTETLGTITDILQKVTLVKFDAQDCSRKYRPGRLIKKGYDARTQMCFGDHTEKRDTCQGDSGGPLQVNNNRVHCMYTIIGVTFFGKNCGELNQPGMYTRVSAYAPWIESIVWA